MLGAVASVVRLSIAAAAAVVPAVVKLFAVAAVVTAAVKLKPGSRAVAAVNVTFEQAAGESQLPVGASLLHPCTQYLYR
jgi:hypothetical protein